MSEAPPRMARLSEVAEAAGVSVATVSRALSGNAMVAKATRMRIADIARAHGFHPNQAARRLRLQRSQSIGLVLPLGHERGQHLSDPFFNVMLGLIADAIVERDHDLLLSRVIPTDDLWLERLTASGRVDAVIVIGQSDQTDVLDRVAERYLPLVVWGAFDPAHRHCTVGTDNRGGGMLAARHLIATGCRRLAFLGNPAAPELRQRHEGVRLACDEAGLAPPRLLPVHLTIDEAYAMLADCFIGGDVPDGIVAGSDVIAMAAVRALTQRGLRVPDDVSVIGYGSNGYFRLNFKYLDDRAVAYLPSPVRVTGTNASPTYTAIPGLSPQNDAIQSINFTRAATLDGANNRQVNDIRDGMNPVVKAIGFETGFDVADGWTVTNRFRYSDISGNFISPFPASVDAAQVQANQISALVPANGTGAGSTLFFATGPQAGQQVTNPATLNGNGLAMDVVLFNTRLRSLNNITNDLRINHAFDIGRGKLDLTAGFYKSRQTIDIDWLWTSFLQSVGGGGSSVLLDVRNAAGVLQTENGVVGYGATFFGNCCRRSYNVDYDTNAPFASLSYKADRLTIDGSLRYDFGSAKGFTVGDGPVTTFDVLGNGTISIPDTRTTVIPATTQTVNYTYNYLSYSLGANYRVGDDLAVFARYSRGGRANADRFLFGSNLNASGGLARGARPVDFVRQAEVGVKYQGRGLSLAGTGFWARTQEQNYEATTQTSFNNTYRAYGVELEGVYRVGGLSLAASGTFTDAKIVASQTAATIGNRPRRQAEFIYKVSPSFTSGMFSIGASAIGTTSSFTQDSNQLKLPGFTTVNAFVSVRPLDRVTVSLNANNLFNVAGYTEAEEGSIPTNGIVRARSINGRTISAALRFDF